MAQPRKIVYASSLVMPDPGTLATLALLYDEVHLPHAYDVDPDGERLMRWSSSNHLDKLEYVQKQYAARMAPFAPYVEAGVLKVLPPAVRIGEPGAESLQQLLLNHFGLEIGHFSSELVLSHKLPLAMHALFPRAGMRDLLTGPAAAGRKSGEGAAVGEATSTESLSRALASALLEVEIPTVKLATAAELVELRARTATLREDFAAFLAQSVDDVESRLAAVGGDVEQAAHRTVERIISPEWREAHRTRAASYRAKLFEALGRAAKGLKVTLKMFCAPWDLGNYAEGAELAAAVLKDRAQAKVLRDKIKPRAFNFLSTLADARAEQDAGPRRDGEV